MNKLWWTVGAVVVIGLAWWGYSATQTIPAETGPIKIGLISPMTGEAATFGDAWAGGAELAVKEINAAGGIDGRQLELVTEDDRCVAQTGPSIFSKLIDIDKVVAIVGPLCSTSAGAGLPIAEEGRIPTIIGASAPSLTHDRAFVFRNYPSDSSQAIYAAHYLNETLGKKSVAVVYVNNDWGIELNRVFVDEFKKLGGEILVDEGTPQDVTDMRTVIAKVRGSVPDAVYLALYPQGGVVALKAIRQVDLNVPLIGTDLFSTGEIFDVADAEGVLFTIPNTNARDEFVGRVKSETGREGNEVSGFAYDAVRILAAAFAEVGTEAEAVMAYLEDLNFTDSVALPSVTFDAEGDLESDASWTMRVVKDGAPVDVQ